MISQVFAGAGLGILVGILLGLSSSPVVSLVVGALATGMVTLLGFVKSGNDAEPAYVAGSAVRLGSFGFACTAAVLVGLCIRTYNWASPSIAEQIAKIQQAGYSPEQARQWVALKNLGAPLDSNQENSHSGSQASPNASGAPTASSVLFSSGNSGQCQYFDTSQYKNVQEHLYALRLKGGTYADYAEKIGALDADEQKTVLGALKLLYCPR